MDAWMDEEMDGIPSLQWFLRELYGWRNVCEWSQESPDPCLHGRKLPLELCPLQTLPCKWDIMFSESFLPFCIDTPSPPPPRDVRKSQTKDFSLFKKRNTWYQLDVNSWSSTVYVRSEDGNQTNTGSSVSFSYMCMCVCWCCAHTPLRHAQFILRACAYDIISHKTWCHRPIGGLLLAVSDGAVWRVPFTPCTRKALLTGDCG